MVTYERSAPDDAKSDYSIARRSASSAVSFVGWPKLEFCDKSV